MADRGPWFISQAGADARLEGVVNEFDENCRRLLDPDMPENVAIAKLRRIYSEYEVRFYHMMSAALREINESNRKIKGENR